MATTRSLTVSALGPMKALEVASLQGARFLGVDQDVGSIAAGKLADLIVLNADPLEDIRNTAEIEYMMKGGILYDAESLVELWPATKEFGERDWVDAAALRSDDRPTDYWDRQP